MIILLSIIAVIAASLLALRLVQGQNKRLQEKLETWDTADARLELDAIHQNLFLRESEWREVLNRDGISVSTTWTQSSLVGKNIRTYRTLSKLHAR